MIDPHNQTETDSPASEENSEAGLDHALEALEGMLENRQVVPGTKPGDGEPGDVDDVDDFELTSDELPVLDNVVQPGRLGFPPPTEEPGEPVDDDGDWENDVELPQHNDLAARLVNELYIIVEDTVDKALAEAKEDLMAKLKDHMDIVLPEIVDELIRRCTEKNTPE